MTGTTNSRTWRKQVRDYLNELEARIAIVLRQLVGHENDTDNPHHTTLENLDDTEILTPTEGQGIWFDEDTGLWKNRGPYQEAFPTGLANGGELNIGPGVNDIEVIAGVGVVVDAHTAPLAVPSLLQLTWDQINEPITVAPAVAGSLAYFAIQDSGTPAVPPDAGGVPVHVGQLIQSATPFTAQQQRDIISLGVAVHNGVEWKEISSPKVINQTAETLRELSVTVLGPTFIIEGGEVTESGTFSVDQASGTVWENNRNWHVAKDDPNREALPAQAPITFEYVNRDFTNVGAPTTVFDPSLYDDGTGAPVTVPGPANTCTVQRLYLDPANNYWVAWGQKTYPNFFAAEASIQADLANSVVPFILQRSILLGFIVAEKAKTAWDIDEAVFVPAVGGGGQQGGGGTPITRHDQLVDVSRDDINPHGNMRWQYPYLLGATYEEDDVVLDDGWTMIANKQTTDRAAPQTVGDPEYTLPDTPAFVTYQNNSVIYSGHLYQFTESGYLRSLRVWVPELTDSTNYSIVFIRNPNSANPVLTRINDPILNENAWTILATTTTLVLAGEELLVYIDALNSGGEQTWAYNWLYGGQVQNVAPVSGDWQINQQENILAINWLDAEAVPVDHQTELQVIPNTIFEISEVGNPANFRHYQVQGAYVEGAGFTQYTVQIVDTGGTWPPPLTEATQIRAVQPVADPTKFVGIDSYWGVGTLPVWAGITSFLEYDGVPQAVQGDEAYGIDIAFQRLVTSPDWDVVTLIGEGGGGGGDFTPEVFAGAGTTGYVPDPITEENKMLRDDGSWDFVDYGEITNPPVIPSAYWALSGNNIYNTNAGNVGIGTTNPQYGRLEVVQSSNASDQGITVTSTGIITMRMWADSNGGNIYGGGSGNRTLLYSALNHQFRTSSTERMRITDTGNVGIGTTSPQEPLHVQSTGWADIQLKSTNATGGVGGRIFFGNPNGGADTATQVVGNPTTLYFSVNSSERMRIDSTGNVGIGTTSPQNLLHVSGSAIRVDGISNAGFFGGLSDYAYMSVNRDTRTGSRVSSSKSSAEVLLRALNNDGHIIFTTSTSNTGVPVERMRINSTGNVGIGTTSPVYKLDVAGDINITGTYRVNGSPIGGGGGSSVVEQYVSANDMHQWAGAYANEPAPIFGDFSYYVTFNASAYVQSADKYRCFSIHVPSNALAGGQIWFTFHWATRNSTQTGNILWRILVGGFDDETNYNRGYGAQVDVVDSSIGPYLTYTTTTAKMTPGASGVVPGRQLSLVAGRIGTDAQDNYAASAYLIGVTVHFDPA